MNPEHFAFGAIFLALLGTPILAPALSWEISKKSKHAQRRVFVALTTFMAVVIFAKVLGVSFHSYEANVAAVSLAFIFYGAIAFSFFRLRPRALGIPLGCIASLPVVGGLLSGTVGALGVLFIVGDSVPIHTGPVKGGELSCYVTSFGNATTAYGGYEVVLAKPLPALSFIEYKVKKQTFNDPSFPPADACGKVVYANG